MSRDLRLLILTDRFPHIKDPISASFVKSQIEYIKNHVEKIYVIALAPFVPKLLSHFSFMEGKGRWDGYAEDYRYDNVEVYFAKPLALPFDFSRRRRGDDSFKRAKKVIDKNGIDFDLIHAHFTYPAGYAGARLKETYGKRFVLTIHEDKNWLLREIESGDARIYHAWKKADRIIRVNKADLKELERAGLEKERLVYIPNGFSSRLFKHVDQQSARRMLGIPQDKRVLLNIAALEGYKGQENLIKAMEIVTAARADTILYIVGKGSLRDQLQSLIEQKGLEDKVILSGGNKPGDEIPIWMNSCDLFVLPSLSEGNPTVMFEALGCGKPFVGTNVGGIPEIINDDLGILVEPGDADGLAAAILEGLNKKWSKEYILDYSSQFTWERIAEKIIQQYDAALREGEHAK